MFFELKEPKKNALHHEFEGNLKKLQCYLEVRCTKLFKTLIIQRRD